MKAPQDTLFALVKSLTEEENKAFKKSLTVYTLAGRKNLFLVLFALLEKMDSYSYDNLVLSSKGKIPVASLSSLKSQLKRKLISYLRENDTHHYKRWHEMLEEANILCRRGVFEEAQTLLNKVKDEANEANRKYYVIAALRLEGLITQQLKEKDMFTATRALGNEILATAKDVLLTSRIYDFYTTIAAITFKGNIATRNYEILSVLKELYAGDLYRMDTAGLNPDQMMLLLVGRYTLARLLCKMDELYGIVEARIELIRLHFAYFQKYQPQNIPTTYVDYIETCTLVKNETSWARALVEYKAFLDQQFPGTNFYSAFYVYLQQSYIIHNGGSKAEVQGAINHLEPYYKSNKQLPVLNKKMFEMSLLWGYYRLGEYDKSLDYARKLTQENVSAETADDIEDLIRIVSLAIRFEQLLVNGLKIEQVEGFNSFVMSEYHHFRKRKEGDSRLELELIAMFRKVEKTVNKKALLPMLQELRVTIQQWLDEEIAYVLTFNLGFKVMDWIDKQVTIIERKEYRNN